MVYLPTLKQLFFMGKCREIYHTGILWIKLSIPLILLNQAHVCLLNWFLFVSHIFTNNLWRILLSKVCYEA